MNEPLSPPEWGGKETRDRRQWSQEERAKASELYILHGITDLLELQEVTGIPEGTLRRWRADDKWIADYEENINFSYAKTRENLLFVIFRMSQQLRKSMFPRGEDDDVFIPPDLALELRINRLTHAVERIASIGSFIPTKQRTDIMKEVKDYCYELIEDRKFPEEQILLVFKILDGYVEALKEKKK